MELSTREDIEAPLDRVFALASDFDLLERQVMRRGVEVTRLSPEGTPPEQGLKWRADFRYRGKARSAEVALTRFDPPNALVYETAAGGIDVVSTVDFVALSRSRTRVALRVEMSAKTLSARLLLQSLKLARGSIEKRFRVGIAEYATEIENRLNRPS